MNVQHYCGTSCGAHQANAVVHHYVTPTKTRTSRWSSETATVGSSCSSCSEVARDCMWNTYYRFVEKVEKEQDEEGEDEAAEDYEDADDLEGDAFFAHGEDDGEDDGVQGFADAGHAHKQNSVEADSAIATKKGKKKKRAV